MMGINKPIERKEQSYTQLLEKTNRILAELHNKGDKVSARKVAELGKKIMDEDLTIAFCGHFSAGKSTFINELLQESILPASPIPTSANVVKIQKGEELAHVYFFEGEALEILPPVSFENVKAYCKDGDHVESVAYQYPFKNLPDDLIVLDTPGVDSTDDAHRISTESALHLADVIFYVMDYNHVQSEVNLKFIKDLQDKEKKIYLVVNQIDKHREEELPFEAYQTRINDSFRDWGIEPVSLYYTSLKVEKHPLNDLAIVKETIQLLREDKMAILPITVENALHHLLEEHKKWLLDQQEDKLESLIKQKQNNELTSSEVLHQWNRKKTEWNQIESKSKQKNEDFIHQINQILENANITPFEMRELAQKYLESKQKGFKVGLLFSSKKTMEEQNVRLSAFVEDVADRVKTQIEKFIHEQIYAFLKENDLYQPSIFDQIQTISIDIDEDFVAGQVKQGAGITGEAVLHYTKELAQSIKSIYRKQVQEFIEDIFIQLNEQHGKNNQRLQHEINELERMYKANEEIQAIEAKIEEQIENLLTILYKNNSNENLEKNGSHLIDQYVSREYKRIVGTELLEVKVNTEQVVKDSEPTTIAPKNQEDTDSPKQMSLILKETSNHLNHLQGFQTVVQELRNRANKLDNQSFTVALFGAFSAGKSSFANALLGESILPVSPNPTTASINKISPVTTERPHGTVCVQMKSREQLLQDVQQALTYFQTTIVSLEDAYETIKKIVHKNSQIELEANKKPHFHFLKAFLTGWTEMDKQLGCLLTVAFDKFASYVAQEEKSCFVEWIEVFYDCPLTKEGLTLVDTPGADSIHARHTDVAFEYIKNTDAILFVTYYQHAFSKADREFLIQLGRVKDAFSLDKMFFLVNAADLAHNEEELQLVCDYVENQLTTYGIRNPRLFPVSSLLAIKEKEGKKFTHSFLPSSLMGNFEKAFIRFIQSDLVSMSVHAAQLEINRAVVLLENYIKEAQLGTEEKDKKRLIHQQNKIEIQKWIADYKVTNFQTLLNQEINELLYYVKQRTMLRFSDFFKEAFNPAVLKEDGRNMKEQLASCIHEFLSDIAHNLSQEVRATTVRIENYVKKSLVNWQVEVGSHAQKLENKVTFSTFEIEKIKQMKVEHDFPTLPTKTEKQAIGYFRNSKAFFEKNEKQKLSHFLEEQLSPLMDSYLEQNEEELNSHYQVELQQGFDQVKKNIEQQLLDFFEGMQAALSEEINVAELENAYHQIQLLNLRR
ncbi:dynamin family protein [Sutcliffiella halmapala]|uniref:dynamin family protein n=1 Tax=Sutcliffiella halmapala TaxID=79882 RepID=UPI00099595BB|nr:dynamin family protein [Sutcliffiella halmapala]